MRGPLTSLPLVLAALLAVTLALPALAQAPAESVPGSADPAPAGRGPLVGLEVRGSPFSSRAGERVSATVSLARPAELRLRVVDFDGRTVRELFVGSRREGELERAWDGRDEQGALLPDGPYRVVAAATTDGYTERAEDWITLADGPVYPQAPGFITVAIDPGHGGDYDGAVGADGTREADINLDTGLRLMRMLEGAGIGVVITRTTDGHVNDPPEDRTGDRLIDGDDELAARPDLANRARADLFISIHNNQAVNRSVGGPSTFYFDERSFASRSARLARLIQDEMVAGLAAAVGGDWQPYDHGALIYPYYVLRGFDPPRLRRPTQMPGVLSEGLFLSNPRELGLLRRPSVRGAMAVAYYEAIAAYLARRGPHTGYALASGPTGPVPAGEPVGYEIEVRNQGSEPIRDWRLEVAAVKAPTRYVGRAGRGSPVGEARIPRLAPGESAVVPVRVTAPVEAREWMLIFDARDRDGRRAAGMGAPALQVRLTTVDPPAAASPSPSTRAP